MFRLEDRSELTVLLHMAAVEFMEGVQKTANRGLGVRRGGPGSGNVSGQRGFGEKRK